MRNNKWFKFGRLLYLLVFLSLEAFIYSLFILADFDFNVEIDSSLYKYESIILIVIFFFSNFVISMLLERIDKDYVKEIRYDMIIVGIALLFTLLSDTFLLYLNSHYVLGVLSFIVVQLLYFFRMIYGLKFSNKRRNTSIIIRASLGALAIIVLLILNSLSFLYAITAIYFINIVMNFVDALISTIHLHNDKRFISLVLFTVGLLLFIGCDIFVGISNLLSIGGSVIWIFYLPSQVLISLSGSRLFGLTLGEEVTTNE